MSHVLRPASEKTFHLADALAGIPRCIVLLEAAVQDYISDFADEARRLQARDLARSLSAGCPECGFKASSGALRKLHSLLAVVPGSVPELHKSITDRLLHLVDLVKQEGKQK